MAEKPALEPQERALWRDRIREANRHNIFCCCRACKYEWVDSLEDAACPTCGCDRVERIPCWQFPDG